MDIQEAAERLTKCITLCDRTATEAKNIINEAKKGVLQASDVDLLFVELQHCWDLLYEYHGLTAKARNYLGYYIREHRPLYATGHDAHPVNMKTMVQAFVKALQSHKDTAMSDISSNPPENETDNYEQSEINVDSIQLDETDERLNAYDDNQSPTNEEKDQSVSDFKIFST